MNTAALPVSASDAASGGTPRLYVKSRRDAGNAQDLTIHGTALRRGSRALTADVPIKHGNGVPVQSIRHTGMVLMLVALFSMYNRLAYEEQAARDPPAHRTTDSRPL
jgi:hypothetical protein